MKNGFAGAHLSLHEMGLFYVGYFSVSFGSLPYRGLESDRKRLEALRRMKREGHCNGSLGGFVFSQVESFSFGQ